MANIDAINQCLQARLEQNGRQSVTAVEAAKWLEKAGLLKDSSSRPGKPLRDLLRAGRITGQVQSGGHWFIHRLSPTNTDQTPPRAQPPERPSSSADVAAVATFKIPPSEVLSDILGHGLRIVFVGTAVGDTSARRNHYYAGASNAFYGDLYGAGLTPRLLSPEDDQSLLQYGIGLTDLVKDMHASADSALPPGSLSAGVRRLRVKLREYHPAWVCFNGKAAYRAFSGSDGDFGEIGGDIEGCHAFLVPSTSGRVDATRVLRGKTRGEWFADLASRSQVAQGEQRSEPRHLVVPEESKGWSYRRLFGEYVDGSTCIVIRDPYVRRFFQNRNLMEFLQMVHEQAPVGQDVVVHLITRSDPESHLNQEEMLNQIRDAFATSRVDFHWNWDDSPEFHARSISTETGWKILIDRGLDIFQKFDTGAFSLEKALQEERLTRRFEVTYLREQNQVR